MKPSKGLTRPKAVTPKVKPVVVKPKVAVIPVGERYNQNAKPDPMGQYDVTGARFPADRLQVSDAPARKQAAGLAQKQVRADREAARRAGYKE